MSDADKYLTYEVWDPLRSTAASAEWVTAMNANEAARLFAWQDQEFSAEDLYGAGRVLMVRSPNGDFRYLVRRIMATIAVSVLVAKKTRHRKGGDDATA